MAATEIERFGTAAIDWSVSRLALRERRAMADKLQDRPVTLTSSKVAKMIPDIVARLVKKAAYPTGSPWRWSHVLQPTADSTQSLAFLAVVHRFSL